MGASNRAKSVKVGLSSNFPDKDPRAKSIPENYRTKTPAWRVGQIDLQCSWGFTDLDATQWWEQVHPKLKNFETMTWQEIFSATGGPSRGNNHHEVPIRKLIDDARKRLEELQLNDIDSLMSLRLNGQQRIWGILDGFVLKLLWFDPEHKICPSIK